MPNVWKLCTSSNPGRTLTFLNSDIPKTEKMNMTRVRRRQMFTRAGNAMTSEKRRVLIPLAPLISLRIRPILTTRT